ncbi:SUKH-4 family immunity protein [Streptomyces sp. NBC_00876]|uniref:SUKH-4 family immunity protein n=1 Tax=Streptomyces sp. NBC_00876 TaxID=2975853 RepID=UPI00386B40FD|nr:SUKH-4 family immunity protein [Streptomyces sp. NBC_00876]
MIFDTGTGADGGTDGGGDGGSGRSGYVRASRAVLADVVRRSEDLRALCETGFPQSPFRMAPALAADDCVVERTSVVDLGDEVEMIEEESGVLLLFGAVQGWYLFLHLGDGSVHAVPDEMALFDGDLRPVHTDLSSLRRMLELLHRRELEVAREPAGGDRPTPYAELDRFADGIQHEFERLDPVVFSEESDRESPWVYFFGDLRGGLYGTYYYRLDRG